MTALASAQEARLLEALAMTPRARRVLARRDARGDALAVIRPREASILAALADAAAAPEPPLPPVAATDAAAAFDAWLAAAPARNRVALRAALLALERASGRRRFRSLDRAGRLAVLRRLQRSRVPLVPQLAEALRSAAVVSYHGDARVMAALGYDAQERVRDPGRARRWARTGSARRAGGHPRTASPALERSDGHAGVTPWLARRIADAAADVCVIGAGAGGAVVAKELAEGGARVVVLEEGGDHPAESLTGRPRDMMARLYRDGGQIATLGRPPIVLPLGRGVGGTTLVNSGTCFRTPDRVLARWRAEFGLEALTPAALAPVFDRVEDDARRRRGPRRARRRQRRADPPRRGAARLVGRLPAAQRARLPGQRRVRLRLSDRREAARRRRLPRARARARARSRARARARSGS